MMSRGLLAFFQIKISATHLNESRQTRHGDFRFKNLNISELIFHAEGFQGLHVEVADREVFVFLILRQRGFWNEH